MAHQRIPVLLMQLVLLLSNACPTIQLKWGQNVISDLNFHFQWFPLVSSTLSPIAGTVQKFKCSLKYPRITWNNNEWIVLLVQTNITPCQTRILMKRISVQSLSMNALSYKTNNNVNTNFPCSNTNFELKIAAIKCER